jgi:hypothetical protein
MILNIFDIFPNLLAKGFPGLVIIFAILFYLLFKKQLAGTLSTKDFLIRILPFILVSILLIVLSGYSIYTDKTFDSNRLVDSLKTELQICKGSSPAVESLERKYKEITHKRDSLEKLVSLLNQENGVMEAQLNENIILNIAESFEWITDRTSNKRDPNITDTELNFRIYKNATFQNLLVFGADTSILRKALLVMKKRGENIDINRIVKVTPSLINLKRNWLKSAILRLENKIDSFAGVQNAISIDIDLPKEVWILNTPYAITMTSENGLRILAEKKLLDRKSL